MKEKTLQIGDRMNLIPHVKNLIGKSGSFDLHATVPVIQYLPDSESSCFAVESLQKAIFASVNRTFSIASVDRADKGIVLEVLSATSDSETYRITIDPEKVHIVGESPTGLFWGIQTLRQIVRLNGTKIPCLAIEDSPDFPHRGFYHDVTRGKVPTLDTLKLLADKCAFYKINQLQLYVEHTFAFKGIPELWKDKDPLTADEIRELDAYCKQRFIDLVPSLSTFGHLYELLRLKRFEYLNELDIKASTLPHDLWDRMGHYTIDVGNENSFLLVKSMIEEYLPLFSSRYFNICCDETFDLGKGKNAERAKREGVGRLYVDFVKKIAGVVHAHGKTPMLWGDIVLHYPELICELPPDTIFLNWEYGSDVTEAATKTFAEAGVRQYVCPGVQGWSRFANNLDIASSNIRRKIRFGKQYGATGTLNTDWGDCGHVNFLANSFHGLALGAALSWNVDSYSSDREFDTAFSTMEWGSNGSEIGSLLRELGSLSPYHFGNMYAWVNDLKGMWNRENEVEKMDGADLAGRYQRAVAIHNELAGMRSAGTFEGTVQDLDEFIGSANAIVWTLSLLSFKKHLEFGQDIGAANGSDKTILLADGERLLDEFKRMWRLRNKESELGNVVETFTLMFEKIRSMNG
jgi:hypothetical protein